MVVSMTQDEIVFRLKELEASFKHLRLESRRQSKIDEHWEYGIGVADGYKFSGQLLRQVIREITPPK